MRIAPQLTDAELVRSAVVQAMLGFTSEARWIRHARSHLQHLFPYLPKQHGYNKLLRQAAELLRRVIRLPATDTSAWSNDVQITDSTPVECGCSRETVKRRPRPTRQQRRTGCWARRWRSVSTTAPDPGDTPEGVGTNFAPTPSPRTTNPWECPGTTRSNRPMG